MSKMNLKKKEFLALLRNEISELPFHRLLGLTKDCFDVQNGHIQFDMRSDLVGNKYFNILHGGAIATILDTEGGFLLALNGAWNIEGDPQDNQFAFKGGTVDLRIDYLRPGKGKHFVATGTVLRSGNKVAVVRTELRDEVDELIAIGTGTYLVG